MHNTMMCHYLQPPPRPGKTLSSLVRTPLLIILGLLTCIITNLRSREQVVMVEALTEPPRFVARIDDDWPTGCAAGANDIAGVFPDGKGNVYGSFESCHKIFERDLSAPPGAWTHVAGDGTVPNPMTTQATGTNTPVSTGYSWMGPNSDIIYFCGAGGGAANSYTYNMELTSGNYGITIMAGTNSLGCIDGNVPTPGALPTSAINNPARGAYRVTDGYTYQPVGNCRSIMKLQTSFPYQTEIEWVGDTLTAVPVANVFGTNDPTLLAGGATRNLLINPGSVTFNSAETEMFVPCVTAIVKIVVATRVASLVAGQNTGAGAGVNALAAYDGIGSAAGYGLGYNADWVTQDETLLLVSYDLFNAKCHLVGIDVTTQELRLLPHNVGIPSTGGFVEGPLDGTGITAVPYFYRDPLSPPNENRFFVFAQISGHKGTWTIPTRTVTSSETEDLPTPVSPATPAPPTPLPPVPPTPTPPSSSTIISTSSSTAVISSTTTTVVATTTAAPTTTSPAPTNSPAPTTTTTTSPATTAEISTTTSAEIVFEEQGSPPTAAAFANADGGLSSGEKAGISIGVVLALIVVACIVGFSIWRFKLSKKQNGEDLDAKQIECGEAPQGEKKYLSVSPQEKSLFT